MICEHLEWWRLVAIGWWWGLFIFFISIIGACIIGNWTWIKLNDDLYCYMHASININDNIYTHTHTHLWRKLKFVPINKNICIKTSHMPWTFIGSWKLMIFIVSARSHNAFPFASFQSNDDSFISPLVEIPHKEENHVSTHPIVFESCDQSSETPYWPTTLFILLWTYIEQL